MQVTSSGRLARCPESKVARSLSAMKNAGNDVQYWLARHLGQVTNASNHANIQSAFTHFMFALEGCRHRKYCLNMIGSPLAKP